jgi:hypothetical protein
MREKKDERPAPVPSAGPPDRSTEHREELLDEALEESFPASDPPSPARGR